VVDFYLASSEDIRLDDTPRECSVVRQLQTSLHRCLLLVHLEPFLSGEKFGLRGTNILDVGLIAHYRGDSLLNITSWPVSVYVTLLLTGEINERTEISEKTLKTLGLAEIYKTKEDAKNRGRATPLDLKPKS